MHTLFRSILIAVSLLISMGSVFAVQMPFLDVERSAPYYDAVRDLYEGKIITDNGDHLFRPNDLMNRDFFVSLSVGIGCHKCETPSIEDISKYQISPFIDLPKTNRYYYCIAYAKDNDIAQGYITDNTGKATCENGKQYMSSPFCAENTITRIEAAAILLRRAKLWDDNLNSGGFDRSKSIPDTTTYWYGYAKKGIEIGILKQKSDGKIGQDEKITRGEFAIMAARTLSYTQCQPDIITNTIEAEIGIRNKDNELIKKSTFIPGETFSLVPIVTSGNWNYNWIAKNPNTGEIITMSGDVLPGSKIPEGTWIIDLQVIDPTSNKIVSEPYATITIGTTKNYHGDIGIRTSNGALSDKSIFNQNDAITLVSTHTGGPWDQTWKAIDTDTGNIVTGIGKEFPGSKLGKGSWNITLITKDPQNGNIVDTDIRHIQIISGVIPPNTNTQNLSVILHADPIVGNLGSTIHFSSTTNSSNGLTYSWNYGDGVITTGSPNSDHSYTDKGVYTVIITVTDPTTGETSQSSMIIRITGDRDTDGDGILDPIDQCPLVHAKTITGCPLIPIFNPKNPVNKNTIEAAIGVHDANDVLVKKSNFVVGEDFSLVPVTSNPGSWNYSWTATNIVTGKVESGNGSSFPGSKFTPGDWKVVLNVIDPATGKVVSSPSMTLDIHPAGTTANTGTDPIPCVMIIPNPQIVAVGGTVTVTPTICSSTNPANPLKHSWNYGDGTPLSTDPNNVTHTYTTPGTYTITLKVTDPVTGKTGEATTIITVTGGNTIEAAIGVHDANDVLVKKSNFVVGEDFSLVPVTSNPGSWNYSWTATNIVTGKVESGNGSSFPGSKFTPGDWKVVLKVIDPTTGNVASSSSMTIDVHPKGKTANTGTDPIPCVMIIPNPQIVAIGETVTVTPTVCPSTSPLKYSWNYGDGTPLSTDPNNVTHTYTTPGTYTITLKVIDPLTGLTGDATVVIEVIPVVRIPTGNEIGPSVSLDASPGNSKVNTNITFTPKITYTGTNPLSYKIDYGDNTNYTNSGDTTHSYASPGSYRVTYTVTDIVTKKTGTASATVTITEIPITTQQPPNSGLPFNNVCLEKYRKSQGLLIGTPNCVLGTPNSLQCTCTNSITIDSTLRSCDIVFPTILSPTFDTIYSRGGFYLIP